MPALVLHVALARFPYNLEHIPLILVFHVSLARVPFNLGPTRLMLAFLVSQANIPFNLGQTLLIHVFHVSRARILRGQLPRAPAHAPTALCTPSQQLAALLWRLALVSQAIQGPTAVHARPARKANTRRRWDPPRVLRVTMERFLVRLQARVLILSTSLNFP